MKLFVGGIPPALDDVDIKEMFELYGEVASALVVKDKATGKSKGFAFLDMPNDAEAKEAMELLDGVSIFGKKIGVKQAETQVPKTAAPRYNSNYNSSDSSSSSSSSSGAPRPPRKRIY